jgi:hypothetical protein
MVLALTLLVGALAIAPTVNAAEPNATEPNAALACTWGTATKAVPTQKLSFFGLWTVTMNAAVKYDTCGHVKLAWKQCSVSYVFGWSARVTWCDAYYPGGLNGSTRIDVGFNAHVCAPLRCDEAWSRRWAYGNRTFGEQRWHIP